MLFLSALWRVLYEHPAGLFTWHPAMNSLAIAGFVQGVLLLQPTRTAGEKKKGLQIHQVFQYTALPISQFLVRPLSEVSCSCLARTVLVGSFIIIYNKWLHAAGPSLPPCSSSKFRILTTCNLQHTSHPSTANLDSRLSPSSSLKSSSGESSSTHPSPRSSAVQSRRRSTGNTTGCQGTLLLRCCSLRRCWPSNRRGLWVTRRRRSDR